MVTRKPSKLSVSFKKTTKQQCVYNYFNNLEDKGDEIKKILMEWYEKNIGNKESVEKKSKEQFKIEEGINIDTDITDF